jgi:aryl-alcohol dehydrogenase-like predicted oxidoreductase
MEYSRLGTSGLVVSRLAFGTMTFTDGRKTHEALNTVGKTSAEELVGRACDAGINFFDTSNSYDRGGSEIVLGEAVKTRRKEVVIATKVGMRITPVITESGLSRRNILMSVDDSLRRLGTDWIDIYIAHKFDVFTPLEETLSAFDAVVRTGKVRYLGFSNWSAWQVATALGMQKQNGWAQFTHGQVHYSLLGRDVEREIIPMMAHHNLGMTVWSPLGFSFLTGKLTRDNLRDAGRYSKDMDLLPFDKEHGFQIAELLRKIGDAHGATVPQVAIAWLLSKKPVSSILIGASKLSQLEDNLGATSVQLDPGELQMLDEATRLSSVYPNWFFDSMLDKTLAKELS